MKTVAIIGVGMNRDTLTQEGFAAIQTADLLLGAPRLIEMFFDLGKLAFPEYMPDGVQSVLEDSDFEHCAILLSGDVGFFSAANGLLSALEAYDIRLIPGISSLSYFFARLKRPWQESAFISLHGREGNFVDTVRRSRLTFALTGGNLSTLAMQLEQADYGDLTVIIGENLGAESERILTMPVSAISHADIATLSVLLIENPNADARIRFGIPDEEFERGEVPMTKAEVRAFSLSRLALKPDSICCDIGCGTGSVSVEMALNAHAGRVYAMDKNAEAIRLTEQNARKFHIGNLATICASAPKALRSLPALDAMFIGGSGGQMEEIFSIAVQKNPRVHIVVNAIVLESVTAAIAAFQKISIEPEIVQLTSARAKTVNGLHMMTAQNPIWIISGGGDV